MFISPSHALHLVLSYLYLIVRPRFVIIVRIRHSKRSTKFRKFLTGFCAPYRTSNFQAEQIEGVLISILPRTMPYISY